MSTNKIISNKIDAIIHTSKWVVEMGLLRDILSNCGLTEEQKWGQPCYTLENANVVLIHGFKDYCALLFFKGSIMPDPQNIFIQQTKNVQAARQVRFQSATEIKKQKKILVNYVKEAIKIERSGEKVELKKTAEFVMPVEFERQLKSDQNLQKAFIALTPGRQRAYLLHFSSAKQVMTREVRIKKNIPLIMQGKGLND